MERPMPDGTTANMAPAAAEFLRISVVLVADVQLTYGAGDLEQRKCPQPLNPLISSFFFPDPGDGNTAETPHLQLSSWSSS